MYDLTYRPRRLRTSPEMRDLVRETTLDTTDLIYPLFIVPGEGIKRNRHIARTIPFIRRRSGKGGARGL